MKVLSELIDSFDPKNPHFRPTELYNESWMVKLVLHQASTLSDHSFPLSFLPNSTWFSESLLPTAFKPRFRGDRRSESRTNADGAIGHFQIGSQGKADLELDDGARQFTIIEAKISAPLSAGTSNARYFDQAARNVACMAEVLFRAAVNPASLDRLDFIVLAPQYSIDKGTFYKEMDPKSILAKVGRRVGEYEGELDEWFSSWFRPAIKSIQLHSLSWENVIDWLGGHRPEISRELEAYYKLCLEFN
jgi:hypothetical protein